MKLLQKPLVSGSFEKFANQNWERNPMFSRIRLLPSRLWLAFLKFVAPFRYYYDGYYYGGEFQAFLEHRTLLRKGKIAVVGGSSCNGRFYDSDDDTSPDTPSCPRDPERDYYFQQ